MASHSGYSTNDGSIVQLTIENNGLAAGDACLIYQIYDDLLSIQDGSCSVFESLPEVNNGFDTIGKHRARWQHAD